MRAEIFSTNRKALYSYVIKDTLEAGIVLEGWEVKAIRKGKMNISGAFIAQVGNEVYLMNSSITPCSEVTNIKCEERRYRKLLLHRKEVNKIIGTIRTSGSSAIALKVYTNSRNRIKVEVAIVQGKTKFDKRQTIKEREWNREKAHALKASRV